MLAPLFIRPVHFSGPIRQITNFADGRILMGNSLQYPGILEIRSATCRPGAENIQIPLHFDFVPIDLQVVEARAHEGDRWDLTVPRWMNGGNLSYHTIGSDHIQDVEILNHRSGQRRESGTIGTGVSSDLRESGTIGTGVSSDLRVAGAVGEHSKQLKRRRGMERVLTVFRQYDGGLAFYICHDRLFEMCGEDIRCRSVAVR